MTEEKKEQVKSGILIRFVDVGSAVFDVQVIGSVTPMQSLMIGEYLKTMAKTQIVQMENQAMMQRVQQQQDNKIEVPRPDFKIPDRNLRQ